jgi:hypothetical protein
VSPDIPHEDKPQLYENVDLAPTVCAILGIPVPRQNEGKFIDDAMVFVNTSELQNVYYDLYRQKLSLVQAFIQTTAPSAPPQLPQLYPGASIDEYISAVRTLISIRDDTLRDKAIFSQKVRNILVTTIIALMVTMLFCFLMQVTTMCDILSIFNKEAALSSANRKSCILAFFSVLVYHCVSIAIYNICFAIVGYGNWDSTVIHTPEVLARYAFICLLPSVLVIYVIIRGFHVYYTIRPQFAWRNASEIMDVWLLGREVKFTDLRMVYLYRYYLLFWTVASWLMLLIIQSNYTFVVAPVFQLKFITAYLWELRFRIITVQFMSLPLSLASFLVIFFGLPSEEYRRNYFDPIYMLKIYKDVYRSFGASSLSPNTFSKLSNGVFYEALWKEQEHRNFLQVNNIDDIALIPASTY